MHMPSDTIASKAGKLIFEFAWQTKYESLPLDKDE